MEPQATPVPPTPPIPTPPTPGPVQPLIQPTPVPEHPNNKMSQKLLIPSIVLLVVAVVLVAFKLILTKKVITPPQPTPTASIQPTPSPTPDPTANWKTHTNKEFSFKYPGNWFNGVSSDGTILINNNLFDASQIVEPDQVIITLEIVTDQNLIQAYTKNVASTKKAVGGVVFDLIDLSFKSSEGAPQKQLFFAQVLKKNKLFRFGLAKIESKNIFDQILSTFKFIDQSSAEGKFCGGIAANLPENQCPEGFYCKLDGNHPDAGGVCIKN